MGEKRPVAIFDMDKTLLDSDMKLKTDVANAMKSLGANIKPEEVQGDWYELAKSYGLDENKFDEQLSKRKSWKHAIKDGEAPLFPDSIKCLDKLYENGIGLGLLTRSTNELTQEKMYEHDLEKYFNGNVTVTPVESKNGKYQEAKNLIEKINPETISKAYFIGDKVEDVNVVPHISSTYNIPAEGMLINRDGKELTEEYKTFNSLEKIADKIIQDGR